jgi:spoIIIJ-associated protein
VEWVEASGKSLPEAKEIVLDLLGVAEDDAEFVVLSEPKAGLFGRMRGEARVQARVRPMAPPPKRGRRPRPDRARNGGSSRKQSSGGGGQRSGNGGNGRSPARSEEEAPTAVDGDSEDAGSGNDVAPVSKDQKANGSAPRPMTADQVRKGRARVGIPGRVRTAWKSR